MISFMTNTIFCSTYIHGTYTTKMKAEVTAVPCSERTKRAPVLSVHESVVTFSLMLSIFLKSIHAKVSKYKICRSFSFLNLLLA